MLSPDTRLILQRYVDGNLNNRQLGEWLAGSEYDPAVPATEKNRLAELRLIVLEESEGRRPTEDVLNAVAAALASASPEDTVITVRTSASTTWGEATRVTGAATPARLAGI